MSEHATWERRREQAEKDARETARPVFGSTVGAVYALRPIHERVAARRLEEPHSHVLTIGATAECRGCGRTLDEIVERRQRKQRNAATARRRRFRRPVSAKNAARAAA